MKEGRFEGSWKIFTFKQPSRIFFLKGKEDSGRLSDLGKGEFHSPYFTLVTQPKFADQFQFLARVERVKWGARGRNRGQYEPNNGGDGEGGRRKGEEVRGRSE